MKRIRNGINCSVGPGNVDLSHIRPIEVVVRGSSREDFESALHKFKSLFQHERIVGQLKEKSAYEKPSIKKRRKIREARDRAVMANIRENMIKSGEWDRIQKKRAQKKIKREEKRAEVLDV
jgi:ribosomal protein S21